MAHIQLRSVGDGTMSLLINGVEFAFESYADEFEFVEVGLEVGFRFTICVSRLDIGDARNVQVTDRIDAVNAQIRAMRERDSRILDGEEEGDPDAIPLPEPGPRPTGTLAHDSGV